MTKFIFVRHGESEANRDFKLGAVDTRLTDLGIEQARATGLKLKNKSIKIIVCSKFLRAQQTAEIIAGEIGVDVAHIKVMEDLAERRMGKYEGQPKEHPTEWYHSVEAEDPEFETRANLLLRMHRALKKIDELGQEGLVLVVGHALSGAYLDKAAKGVTNIKDISQASRMENAAYMEIEV